MCSTSKTWIVGNYTIIQTEDDPKVCIFGKKLSVVAKATSLERAFLLVDIYNKMDKQKHKNIPLNRCVPLHWYEVVDGFGLVKEGTTIQFFGESDGICYSIVESI